MKGCFDWADAIRDCALGQAPVPELAAHLAVCAQCQEALRESREMAGRIDAALRRGGTVDPPLYGAERVMARIEAQRESRAWWRWSAGLAIVAALMAIVIWMRRPTPQADVTALTTWRSPTEALLRPPVAAAWTTRPRLGESFFKIKASGEIHAQ